MKPKNPASVAKEKRPQGRPTLYRPEYDDLARKFCLLGATNADLARMFEVDVSTIERWLSAHAGFRGAVKAGRDIADATVASKLYHRAIGYNMPAVKIVADARTKEEHIVHYTEHFPPETTACIFWLKNRNPAQWREKSEQEVKLSGEITSITRTVVDPGKNG